MRDRFHQMLVETTPRLRAFARGLTGTTDQAEDLVQEASARALASRHLFTEGTNFRAWMFTILRNIHLNELRRHHARTEPLDTATEHQTSIAASQERSVEMRDVQSALSGLPREQQRALLLVGADGRSVDEVAKLCGCAAGTVKSRVSRARSALNRRLAS